MGESARSKTESRRGRTGSQSSFERFHAYQDLRADPASVSGPYKSTQAYVPGATRSELTRSRTKRSSFERFHAYQDRRADMCVEGADPFPVESFKPDKNGY